MVATTGCRHISVKVLKPIILSLAVPHTRIEQEGEPPTRSKEDRIRRPSRIQLNPATHYFFECDIDDGRPDRQWALLVNDPDYGIPLKNLRTLEEVTDSVEASDENGDPYFS